MRETPYLHDGVSKLSSIPFCMPLAENSTRSLNPVLETENAPSVISSRMSDIFPQDGENDGRDIRSLPQRTSPRPPTVASTQERSFIPSRASSSATANNSLRGTWTQQRPPSRRGHLNVDNPATLRTSTPGSATSASPVMGRPPSAASRPQSAASRSHVPSLTSHAFFRPMSSQRLQAQRAIRQSRTGHAGSSEDSYSEGGSNTHRHSHGSFPLRRSSLVSQDHEILPPPSRETDNTEHEVPEQRTTSPSLVGNGTGQSLTDSVTPLQDPSPNLHLTLGPTQNHNADTTTLPPPPRSPKSIRSKILGGRASIRPTESRHGREELYSSPSSPISLPSKTHKIAHFHAEKNYKYFTGNTVFCWGGRLQNTRDRPINIITGLFVAVPGGLFLAFSCVM